MAPRHVSRSPPRVSVCVSLALCASACRSVNTCGGVSFHIPVDITHVYAEQLALTDEQEKQKRAAREEALAAEQKKALLERELLLKEELDQDEAQDDSQGDSPA